MPSRVQVSVSKASTRSLVVNCAAAKRARPKNVTSVRAVSVPLRMKLVAIVSLPVRLLRECSARVRLHKRAA